MTTQRACRHGRILEQGPAGRFCAECGERIDAVLTAQPDLQERARQITPIVSAFAIPLPGDETMQVEIARVGQMAGSKFDFAADVWAIRCMQRCLNRDGFWEWEPLPSSRSDEFKVRSRWECAEALAHAQAAVEEGNFPGGPGLRWKNYEEVEDV
jgi:hypothetical protein